MQVNLENHPILTVVELDLVDQIIELLGILNILVHRVIKLKMI